MSYTPSPPCAFRGVHRDTIMFTLLLLVWVGWVEPFSWLLNPEFPDNSPMMILDYVIRYKVHLNLFVCAKNFGGNK